MVGKIQINIEDRHFRPWSQLVPANCSQASEFIRDRFWRRRTDSQSRFNLDITHSAIAPRIGNMSATSAKKIEPGTPEKKLLQMWKQRRRRYQTTDGVLFTSATRHDAKTALAGVHDSIRFGPGQLPPWRSLAHARLRPVSRLDNGSPPCFEL